MIRIVLSVLLCIGIFSGCSQTRSETTVTTTSEPTYPAESTHRTVETTTTTTEDSDEGCGGVLSCTVDVIGSIIALPFKAVGALVGAIF